MNPLTSSPSPGPTPLLSCFAPQLITYSLPLTGCVVTKSYELRPLKSNQTEVIHGIRYDGFASKFYEEKDDEERLRKSVEAFVQMTEAISTTAHFEQ